MRTSEWEEVIKPLQELIMKPIIFNDLSVVLLDALPAAHENDWNVLSHKHPWFELNYISDGAAFTTLEDIEFLVTVGNFHLIPPGVLHSHRHCNNKGDDGFCLRWQFDVVHYCEEFVNATLTASDIISVFSIPRHFCIRKNVGELFESINSDTSIMFLQAAFIKWLISLYELWKENASVKTNVNDHEKILVQQVLLYLSKYYASDLTVEEISNSLNLSYRHLARIFKKVTGITIINKLNDIRISEAKVLLKETDKTISQIALEVGFENEYYFSNTFCHIAHLSPSKFRGHFN